MPDRFTERAQRVILVAEEEAKRLNHDYVGTEHVLLGMIAIGEGVAAQVLSNLGVRLDKVREEILILLGEPSKPESKPLTLANSQEPWYTMADAQEVYNVLNIIGMEIEPVLHSGGGIIQYKYDENTFFKAEALWAEREGLC